MNDAMTFAEEPASSQEHPEQAWNILIVDDEPDVHHVTRLALEKTTFEGKRLNFLSAYSAAETRSMLETHDDIALILLDVVMEEDDSGLQLVKYIRETLGNHLVRIILRTGQPGQAPEKEVIVNYDINDYKAKSELTSQHLFTVIIASLRSYKDLFTIENSRRGLEKIIDASSTIFELQSMKTFVSGVLTQLVSFFNLRQNSLYVHSFALDCNNLEIIAGTGEFEEAVGPLKEAHIPESIKQEVLDAYHKKQSMARDHHKIAYFKSKKGLDNLVFIEGVDDLSELDQYLFNVFCENIAIAFDNINLNEEVKQIQEEILYRLGTVAETRSRETGNHVKRVAHYSKLLALHSGLSEAEQELIFEASPMHDLGKVGIEDAILNKPGPLTAEEFEKMKGHARIGYEMLKDSRNKVLHAASIIALQHHEKYNGNGYPDGLKGQEIHIYGRIVALADVFDALGSRRIYKGPWELEQILEYLRDERGGHFDPELIDLMFGNLDAYLKIREELKDE